jgi:hypothetical protein
MAGWRRVPGKRLGNLPGLRTLSVRALPGEMKMLLDKMVIGTLADEYASNPTGECRPPVTAQDRVTELSIGRPILRNPVYLSTLTPVPPLGAAEGRRLDWLHRPKAKRT